MDYNILVDAELDRVEWVAVQQASGSAETVPRSFKELLAASNEDEVKRAYWKLENHVVVQGRLYEAAIHLVPAICAALVDPGRTRLTRTWLMELLFQICNGYHVPSSNSTVNPPDIAKRCKDAARNALWILYGDMVRQEIKIVENLIALLELDPLRLSLIRKRIPNYKAPDWSTNQSR